MIAALLQGIALGFSLAAPPGPVNALIARESSRHGVAAGIRAGLPAPIVDSVWLILVAFGLPRILDLPALLPWLSGAGALLLGYLAWSTVQPKAGASQLAGPWAVWAVTLTNPFQYAWWATAGAAFTATLGPWGVAGFMLAIFAWVGLFAWLAHRGAQAWPWFTPLLEVLMADLLLVFALRLGWVALLG